MARAEAASERAFERVCSEVFAGMLAALHEADAQTIHDGGAW
jgi:hypothetical protein